MFILSAHVTFSRIDYIVDYKTSLSEFKIEIIPDIFSDHNDMKPEVNK